MDALPFVDLIEADEIDLLLISQYVEPYLFPLTINVMINICGHQNIRQ